MTIKSRLSFAEAAAFQAAFDAVEAGTATLADAQEVEAVMAGFEHLRAIGAKAGQIVDARVNQLAGVPEAKRAAIAAVLDGDARLPAILFDRELRAIGTEDDIAAERARLAEEEAAAKQATEDAAKAAAEEAAAAEGE